MEVKKLIVDKKPNTCTPCPLAKLKICGKVRVDRVTSGAIGYLMEPDGRCRISEE